MWFSYANVYSFFLKTVYQNKSIFSLFFTFVDWVLINLRVSKLESTTSDKSTYQYEIEKSVFFGGVFWFIDLFFLYYTSYKFSHKQNLFTGTNNIKLKQLNNGNFYNFNNNSTTLSANLQTVFLGLVSIWKHLRFWLLPVSILILFVYYSFFLKSLPFSKVFFGYLLIGNMFYLLFSGFVFFIKKYQYRLFTSVIQRFWRRTLFIFWAIEGSLFAVFVYLIFNSSQEPINVYDNIQIFKTHFYSWRYFMSKIFLSTLLILLVYLLLLSIKWNTFTKTNNIAFFITVILLYVAWLEFYQLFHLMNCYGSANWVYDFSEHLWNLELEFKRTRIANHYVTIGLVAKFWHVVFAVVFWVFFLLRGVESSRYRYPLLAANLQNFVIIYIMSWLYMYPWFKYVVRKTMDMPYFWFFVNNRKFGLFLFFNDVKLYFFGVLELFNNCSWSNNFTVSNFYYWHESSTTLSNTQFRKHNIRDLFIRSISN